MKKFADLVNNSIIFETSFKIQEKDVTKDIENKSLIKSNNKYFTTLANYKERNKLTDSKKYLLFRFDCTV